MTFNGFSNLPTEVIDLDPPRIENCFYCGSNRLEWYEEWPGYPEVLGRDFKQVCLCCGREDYV